MYFKCKIEGAADDVAGTFDTSIRSVHPYLLPTLAVCGRLDGREAFAKNQSGPKFKFKIVSLSSEASVPILLIRIDVAQ